MSAAHHRRRLRIIVIHATHGYHVCRARPALGEPSGSASALSASTEVRVGLVHSDGLRGRTAPATVPDMFGRHRTDPHHDLATVADAFHERLAGSMVTHRTDPLRRVSPLHLRDRLAPPVSAGLRERLERPRLGTA
jgi:hypothetical protein